jgi:hypothetical protein
MQHVRNLERVQFAELRAQIDPLFNALHDSLEDAYYGAWKHGRSQPWHGFDMQPTPAESKAQFDLLHGALWWAYDAYFDQENRKQARPYPAEAYEEAEGVGPQRTTKSSRAKARLAALPADVRAKLAVALAQGGIVVAES